MNDMAIKTEQQRKRDWGEWHGKDRNWEWKITENRTFIEAENESKNWRTMTDEWRMNPEKLKSKCTSGNEERKWRLK